MLSQPFRHQSGHISTVDISLLLKAADPNESSPPPAHKQKSRTASSVIPPGTRPDAPSYAPSNIGIGGKRSMAAPHPAESPAKKQSKWSPEEDALIIELRGGGMKWEDISKRLPGRSAISCRLHYQNYLERRSEWDEERKNKLARLYERFKPEMWAKVAEEMAVPWRAAEAMHWQLGEADMARRAGVVPFSLSTTALEASPAPHHRPSPNRSHSRGPSHSVTVSGPGSSTSRYSRPAPSYSSATHARVHSANIIDPIATVRRESLAWCAPTSPGDGVILAGIGSGTAEGVGRGAPLLPSLQEMTTGVSPYDTPAYAAPLQMGSGPGPVLPSIGNFGGRPDAKRRASPGILSQDSSKKRR